MDGIPRSAYHSERRRSPSLPVARQSRFSMNLPRLACGGSPLVVRAVSLCGNLRQRRSLKCGMRRIVWVSFQPGICQTGRGLRVTSRLQRRTQSPVKDGACRSLTLFNRLVSKRDGLRSFQCRTFPLLVSSLSPCFALNCSTMKRSNTQHEFSSSPPKPQPKRFRQAPPSPTKTLSQPAIPLVAALGPARASSKGKEKGTPGSPLPETLTRTEKRRVKKVVKTDAKVAVRIALLFKFLTIWAQPRSRRIFPDSGTRMGS